MKGAGDVGRRESDDKRSFGINLTHTLTLSRREGEMRVKSGRGRGREGDHGVLSGWFISSPHIQV